MKHWLAVVAVFAVMIGCGDDNPAPGDRADGPGTNGGSSNGGTNGGTNNGTDGPIVDGHYHYLLIEDLSGDTAGPAPGAHIDGLSICKKDSGCDWTDERYATRVEAFETGGLENVFNDPADALGPPDSECELKNLFAMGGGFLIVSFSTDDDDVIIEDGDLIIVYALGPSVCRSQPGWTDDDYLVSISTSTEREAFIVPYVDRGLNVFPVSLP